MNICNNENDCIINASIINTGTLFSGHFTGRFVIKKIILLSKNRICVTREGNTRQFINIKNIINEIKENKKDKKSFERMNTITSNSININFGENYYDKKGNSKNENTEN